MVAMDVAMAIFTAISVGTPRRVSTRVTKGTIIMPPPTPSRPARNPAPRPRASNSAISTGVEVHARIIA